MNSKPISRSVTGTKLAIRLTIFFTVVMNLKISSVYFQNNAIDSVSAFFQMISFFSFLALLIFTIFNTFNFKYIQKPVYTVFFLVSAPAFYFSMVFNTLYDKSMIRNLLETDVQEALDLMNPNFLITYLFLGILPLFFLWKIPVAYPAGIKSNIKTLLVTGASLLLAVASTFPFYSKIGSFVSNNSDQLAYSLLPYAPIDSFYENIKDEFKEAQITKQLVDPDARINKLTKSASTKPLALVVLIGETARAKSFQLKDIKGAEQEEHLTSHKNLIYFTNFWSCGTNTAASLPCMFSTFPQKTYIREFNRKYENVAELIQRVGYDVTWMENNSGCKGLCKQFAKLRVNETNSPEFKAITGFFDEALVDKLGQRILAKNHDQVIFLHTMGSHGPAYYKRVPEKRKYIQPACESEDLASCTNEEITNAYNNTVIYTKHVIQVAVAELESISDRYDSVLIYLSDHGESTGENGYYLHGLPYFMAPDVQKHIPALIWFSEGFIDTNNIDVECLTEHRNQILNHDYFSHTLLNILNIKTSVYEPELSLLNLCENK